MGSFQKGQTLLEAELPQASDVQCVTLEEGLQFLNEWQTVILSFCPWKVPVPVRPVATGTGRVWKRENREARWP